MGVQTFTVLRSERRGPYATLTMEGRVTPSEPGQFYMLKGDWAPTPCCHGPSPY